MPVLTRKMCVCHQCNIILVITRVETRTTALNTVLKRVALGRLAPGSADGSHYTYTCCSQVTCSRRCSARDYSRAHGSAPLVHCPVTSYMPTARAATGMRRHAHSDTRTTMFYDMHHRSDTITPRATCNTATTPATSLAHMH